MAENRHFERVKTKIAAFTGGVLMWPLPMSPPNIKRKWRFLWAWLLFEAVACWKTIGLRPIA